MTFVERVDHTTGERAWTVADEDYDLIQEVARSRFGDMILDFDRNDRYEAALKTVIGEMKQRGERVHVLDIGTGTGLLSLMAARAGADRVTALEVFAPMAEVARKIVASSPYADRITVIASRSTDLEELGDDRPNVIVAEVFDTELIGEGALRTFKEALQMLVQPGCHVIPARARFYVQPVDASPLLRHFNAPPEMAEDEGGRERGDEEEGKREKEGVEKVLRVPGKRRALSKGSAFRGLVEPDEGDECTVTLLPTVSPLSADCPGSCAVCDVQLSELRPGEDFVAVAEPLLAFEFNFEDAPSIVYDESFVAPVVAKAAGRADAVLAWWDLDMDGRGYEAEGREERGEEGEEEAGNVLTMAPAWKDRRSRWRDHWMQAVYFLPEAIRVTPGARFPLLCCHDEFSLWFAVHTGRLRPYERPYCTCSFHSRLSRTAIFRLNSAMADGRLRQAVSERCSAIAAASPSASRPHVVWLGGGSLIGLLATSYTRRVTVVEPNASFRAIVFKYARHYGLTNVYAVADIDEVTEEPSLLVCEPSVLSAVLPWEHLSVWFQADRLRKKFGSVDIPVMPEACSVWALPMRFRDLHTTAARVGTVSGFNLVAFDELSEKACSAVDALVEDHTLWEYAGQESGERRRVAEMSLRAEPQDVLATAEIQMRPETNGIALWTEWRYSDDYSLSTGRERPNRQQDEWWFHGGWHAGHKQGVFFIPPEKSCATVIHAKMHFSVATGDTTFAFADHALTL